MKKEKEQQLIYKQLFTISNLVLTNKIRGDKRIMQDYKNEMIIEEKKFIFILFYLIIKRKIKKKVKINFCKDGQKKDIIKKEKILSCILNKIIYL